MSNLIDTSNTAALCGSGSVTMQVNNNDVTENSDGSVNLIGGTKGFSEHGFKIELRVTGVAATQVKVLQQEAIKNGKKGFKCYVSGPAEVELGTNKVGKEEQPVSLAMTGNLLRPALYSNEKDPLQNTFVLCGHVVQKVFKDGGTAISLEFGHLASEIQEGDSPAAVKLSTKTAELLAEYVGQDVMLCGSFSRWIQEKPDGKYNAYDSFSFSADSGQLIAIAGGKTRYNTRTPRANSVATTGYEDQGNSEADNKGLNNDIEDMDF